MKFSRQREIILQFVRESHSHPTADEVYTALKKGSPELSLGTVYRNLNRLSGLGMIKKIPIADGSDRFDGRTDSHYHLICERCGAVYDIDYVLPDVESAVLSESGHKVTFITLSLRGICKDCLSKDLPKQDPL